MTLPSRSSKKRKSRLWVKILLFIFLLFLMGAGYYAYSFVQFAQDIQADGSVEEIDVDKIKWTGKERVNILLLGIDNRMNDKHPRSDTIIIVSIDPKTKKAHMFSVMRDTWVEIPGYYPAKINTSHALGGPVLVKKTVEQFLGLPIHYYLRTDFQGFEKIVDVLGGIDFYVEKDMYYKDDGRYDIHLKKGMQHLNGKEALQYVRFRHDALGDYTRTERQRQFLKAMAEKVTSGVQFVKIPGLLKAAAPYISTDMKTGDMLRLAALGYQLDFANMETYQIPRSEDTWSGHIKGQSVLVPNVKATREFVHQTLGLPVPETVIDDNRIYNQVRNKKTVAKPEPKPNPAPDPDKKVTAEPSEEVQQDNKPAEQLPENPNAVNDPDPSQTDDGQQQQDDLTQPNGEKVEGSGSSDNNSPQDGNDPSANQAETGSGTETAPDPNNTDETQNETGGVAQ